MKALFLLLIFQFLSAHAEDSKSILVRAFKGQENLNPSLSSAIRRTVLKKLAEIPGYSLMISSSAPPVATVSQIFALEGMIKSDNGSFQVELMLLDLKNQKVINAVKKSQIREEDLVRMIQAGIEALFLPVQKPIKSSHKDELSPEDDFNSYVNSLSQDSIDFKKIIQSLMQETDKAVVAKSDQTTIGTQNDEKNQQSQGQEQLINQVIAANEDSLFNKEKWLKIIKDHSLSGLVEKKSILTRSLIETTSESTYFRLIAGGHVWRDKDYRYSIDYLFHYSNALDAKVPSPSLMSIGLNWTRVFKILEVSAGPSREQELFYNIQSPGSGLAAGMVTVDWINLILKKKIGADHKAWHLLFQYKHALASKTDWKVLDMNKDMQGQAFQVEIIPPLVVKGFNFRIIYQNTNLKAQGVLPFTLAENRLMTGAHYQF